MNIAGAGSAQLGLLQASFGQTQRANATSSQQIATGHRINSAGDDPSGLSILTSLLSQDQGMEQAITNIQSSAGMMQVGQAGADSITQAVQQARGLAVRAADGSLNDGDRAAMNTQMHDLMREINQTAGQATFNGKPLLDGSLNMTVQKGPNEGDTSNLKVDRLTADSLFGTNPGNLSIATQADAEKFLGQADKALNTVGTANLNMGQFNQALNRTLDEQRSNLTSMQGATSAVGDTDFAKAATNQAVSNILSQANLAMTAQNNANSKMVLSLFG